MGRMERFLMNVMMAAGGYAWTVIPLSARNTYMTAMEFLAGLVTKGLAGEPLPKG